MKTSSTTAVPHRSRAIKSKQGLPPAIPPQGSKLSTNHTVTSNTIVTSNSQTSNSNSQTSNSKSNNSKGKKSQPIKKFRFKKDSINSTATTRRKSNNADTSFFEEKDEIPEEIATNSNHQNTHSNIPNIFRRKTKAQQEHEAAIHRSTTLLDEFSSLMTNEFPTEDPKSTTLHIACLKHYSDSLIVDHLLKQGPDAVSKPNSNNDLPLHVAMKDKIDGGVTERVIDSLLYLHPQAVTHTNNDGCLPLHIACHYGGPNLYAIQRLVSENPNSLMTKCQLRLPFDPKAKEYIIKEKRSYDDIDDLNESKVDEGMCFWLFGTVPRAASSTEKGNSFESITHTTTNDPYVQSSNYNNYFNNYKSNSQSYDNHEQPIDNEREETDFTPLHLAVLSGAAPDVIEYILNTKPECLKLHTSQGRKALDCAKFAVIHQLASPPSDDEQTVVSAPIKNIFAAIEIIETFVRNQRKKEQLSSFISSRSIRLERSYRSLIHNTHDTMAETFDSNDDVEMKQSTSFTINPRKEWQRISSFSKRVLSTLSIGSPLGPEVEVDEEELLGVPSDFDAPAKLAHLCVDIDLPVGFQRLRWAFLSNGSSFVNDEIHKKKLQYTKIKVDPWDIHNDDIGATDEQEKMINDSALIGAERKIEYMVPKSGLVKANMAYENMTIVEYNDYCFAIKKVTTNPDVPFGSTFECHTLMVFTNLGANSCKLVASVEARFVGKPPMIAWKIKNGMYSGVTDYFVAVGEVICEHAD